MGRKASLAEARGCKGAFGEPQRRPVRAAGLRVPCDGERQEVGSGDGGPQGFPLQPCGQVKSERRSAIRPLHQWRLED